MARHSPPPARLLGFMVVIVAADVIQPVIGWQMHLSAIIWPGLGVLLGALMICPPTHLAATLVAGFVAMLEAGSLLGEPGSVILATAAARAASIGIAALLLRRQLGRSTDITRAGVLVAFATIACIAAPLAAASVVTLARLNAWGWPQGILTTHFATTLAPELLDEYLAQALGIGLVTPLVLALYRQELRALFMPPRRPETLCVMIPLLGVTAGVFAQGAYPFLFLTFPPLLLVVARLGFSGAVLAIPLIALIAAGFTWHGHVPLSIGKAALDRHALVLQIYLATAAAIALATGVIVAERRRLDLGMAVRETRARFAEAKLRTSEQLHRLMSENASDVISRFALDGTRLYVSPSVSEILGWSEDAMTQEDWKTRVHPDDHIAFAEAGAQMRAAKERIIVTYRYARPDGSWAWIEARLRLVRDAAGQPKEFISNARDISQQKVTEQALADAMDELSVLATTDGLTGLANRRRFDETLRREWRRAMRSGEPVALLMIDADNFKRYNDIYGHPQGDACLRVIATNMASNTRRPGDLCARYGGEEFAMILPNTSLDGACELGERVRLAIESLARVHAGTPSGVVTVSIGVAALVPERHSTITTLVDLADAALYAAKDLGRNRVERFAGTTMPPSKDVAPHDDDAPSEATWPEDAQPAPRRLRHSG